MQLIFIFLYQHISKLLIYFWSIFLSVQLSALYVAVFQMQHFTSFFLKFLYGFLLEKALLLNATLPMKILDLILRVYVHSLLLVFPTCLY
jgi:hypothetical protein